VNVRTVAGAVGTTIGAIALMTATSWFFATMPLWGPVMAVVLVVGARRRARREQPEADRG
jgi:UDP-N-acetylmuramyl pentapeptide phosphotransferase/UDP-N-acetylglucosamine-1-phosphate transferase